MAIRNVKISDDDADARRATGVTTIVTAPSFGIFNGQSVMLNLTLIGPPLQGSSPSNDRVPRR